MRRMMILCFVMVFIAGLAGCFDDRKAEPTKTIGPVKSEEKKESAGESVYSVTPSNFKDYLIPTNQAVVKVVNGSVVIESTGTDPIVETRELNLAEKKEYWLSIKFVVPSELRDVATEIFVWRSGTYYDTPAYLLDRYPKGENSILVRLEKPSTIKRIRFDPGQDRGTFVIKEFAIKANQVK
jgi:hypothetical protein